ncbi:MAG: hypothetical protein ACI3Z5_01230 [Paludibacteraceae bacterium]
MKKQFIFIALILLTLCACSNESTESEVKVQQASTYKEQIYVLNNKYNSDRKVPQSHIQHLQAKKVNGCEVAMEDVNSGIIIGEAVYHNTKMKKLAIAAAIIGGAFCSYGEYVEQRDDSTKSVVAYKNGNFAIDLRKPIGNHIPTLTTWLPNTIGSEIGMYHNYVIAEVQTNPIYEDVRDNASSELLSTFGTILQNICVCTANEFANVEQVISSQNLLETWKDESNQFTNEEEGVLVSNFLSAISNMKESLRYDYICQYMQIINNAYLRGELSEISALLVNGAVSIWYYSHNLWKYYIPLKGQATAYMLEVEEGHWYITDSFEKLSLMSDNYSPTVLGIPNIIDGHITEIYFFEDIDDFLETEMTTIYDVPELITITQVEMDLDIHTEELYGTYLLQDISDRSDIKYVSF